jgi:2-dehydropantoate 2-reductase
MLPWLWTHALLSIAFESVSVAGVHRGGGASWGEAMRIARGVQESVALIRALGHPVYPSGKARLLPGPVWLMASGLWAMSRVNSFRELLAAGASKCCALVDELLAAAARSGAPLRTARFEDMKPAPESTPPRG